MLSRRHKGLRPIELLEAWFRHRQMLKAHVITIPEPRKGAPAKQSVR